MTRARKVSRPTPSLTRPKVSICLPSRNRQVYLKQTIVDITSNKRDDVEFIVADNSDDGSIMQEFMETLDDKRVRFLPSPAHPLGMRDNCERCVEHSRGDWITVCGDDDYLDPNVADLLDRALEEQPQLDALTWSRIYFRWPDNRSGNETIWINLMPYLGEMGRDFLVDQYFMWRHRSLAPAVPFTVFHCLISRKLLEDIRSRFGGRYFGHTTVDVDNCCKILALGKKFMYSTRPFSVDGAGALSNQARARGAKNYAELQQAMVKDLGFDPNADALTKRFPFPSTVGIAASGAQAIEYFKSKYGLVIDGWQENFAKACEADCLILSIDQKDYERRVDNYRASFARWENGRYAQFFSPPPLKPVLSARGPTGVHGSMLMIDENLAGIQHPKELYDFATSFLTPIDQLQTVPALQVNQLNEVVFPTSPSNSKPMQKRYA